MKNIDWHLLRTVKGSQQAAFEEVCCQLAASEHMPSGSRFIRVGAPDAGVECYWILPQGDEQAWQAKFFTATPTRTQWGEVDESFKTAFEKHPRLVKYTICFPLERADPRRDNEQWFMDKWNEQVTKWKDWAQAKGRSVEFDYWGEHDLLLRLSKEEHRGRFFFWFHQELLSDHWFQGRLDEAIASAGPRYTPQLNVDLPIGHLFDGLGRTGAFFERLYIQISQVKQTYRSLLRYHQQPPGEEYQNLAQQMQELSAFSTFNQENVDPINWEQLQHVIATAYRATSTWVEKIEQDKQAKEQDPSNIEQKTQQKMQPFVTISELRQLIRALRVLESLIRDDEARLTNVPALLLVGAAGTGKTHLFCDIARHRQEQRQPTILLLGEKFRDSEPWMQMRSLLSLSCDRDEFLGALNTAGEARRQRVLILIDALNEGEGKLFWSSFLAEILTTLSRYPWIGIAISVRSSYEEVIVPEGLVPTRLIRAIHEGFTEHEYEATRIYFDHYGIERPSIPLLLPEFRNPLFLKLFCQGLQAGNYTRIPEGLQGITTVFTFFLDNLNNKLAKPRELDLNPNVHHVRKALQALTHMLAERQTSWLPHEEAQTIVDHIVAPRGYDRSLFRRLITEGVLSEDRFPEREGEHFRYVEGIRFAYERLSDHLITEYLLNKHLNTDHPHKAFEPEGPLGQLICSIQAQWQNRGLIEALSIQIPERLGEELCDLMPTGSNDEVIRTALVESLLWRDPASITKKTLQCLTEHALCYRETFQEFLLVLLTVAMNPSHPLNADFLHRKLIGEAMAERDVWWSTFLYNQYDDKLHSPVNRLIDWAWKAEERSQVEDEPLRLACTTLCWFLTTSHRFLRDRATKALVQLLEKRFPVLKQLLGAFSEVNDLYVSERLYAVTYGCAMRGSDHAALKTLAQDVYDRVFSEGLPPSNILLRDYARGVVERALALNLDITVQPEKIRPPYHNTWPENIPSDAEIKQLVGTTQMEGKEMSFQERGRFALDFSVMHWDFARYIIGTNASSKWSSRRLADPVKPSRRERASHFLASLTRSQQHAVERFRMAYAEEIRRQMLAHWSNFLQEQDTDERSQEGDATATQALTQQSPALEGQEGDTAVLALEEEEVRLRKILGKRKAILFDLEYVPWLEQPEESEERLDLSLLQRWILKRVFELGWTMERFGEFDARVSNRDDKRSSDKPERIGKKYQWIAYYDILARMTDTFVFRDHYGDEEHPFEGPWQINPIRNLDPSFLLENTCANKGLVHISAGNWWCLPSPCWDTDLDDKQWLAMQNSLPDPRLLIEVKRPVDQLMWLTLDGHYAWKQPLVAEEKREGLQGREVWYFLESCLVKRSDAQRIFAWAKKHNFSADHLPGSLDKHNIYLGEWYWSPCYLYHYNPIRSSIEWTKGDEEKIPVPVTSTAESYNWTRGYDCSIEGTLSCTVPSKYLAEGMKLLWNGKEGQYVTPSGELAALDPSIYEAGPSALLVQKELFLKFLQDNNLAILWTVRGEKNAYGDGSKLNSFSGRLTITGVYMYTEQGLLQGKLSVKSSSEEG